ncbi:MAG: helix-turn-helix transcriptional regulator [Armatimonadota bacterium]|nr:helix-turn-helix transcriptional regulator [Armatimonadota bacterium]
MSRVSAEYGRLIRQILADNGLTLRAASLRTSISSAYWKDMADGRVPSEDVIDRIAAEFNDVNVNDLRLAAGYSMKTDVGDAVTAVEFALRGQKNIPDEGKKQILQLVKRVEEKYSKKVSNP